MKRLLKTIWEQIDEVESKISAVLLQDQAWATSANLLQSVNGIGVITTAWLLVATLNFTTCETVEALTDYAGLAPALHQSGSS